MKQHQFKVFRYSFSLDVPSKLNQLFNSLPFIRSIWKLRPSLEMFDIFEWGLVFDWKSFRHEICANQMWYEKANTSSLNYGVWQTIYKKRNILYVCSRVNSKNIPNYTTVNEPTVEHCFDGIASNNIKCVLKLCFEAMKALLLSFFTILRTRPFLVTTPRYQG